MTDNKSWMFNYDDIFFCYHTEEGIVFDKTIDFHSLIYIHTGELLVNDGKRLAGSWRSMCVSAPDLRKAIEYDLEQERQFDYSKVDRNGLVSHIAKFVSGLWQIHPFGEGNTRTTAVFTILYLRSMGFDVTNDLFANYSWYFRNALVRANYQNVQKGIMRNSEYLERFFRNLLLGENNELRNRYMVVNAPKELVTEQAQHDNRTSTEQPTVQVTEQVLALLLALSNEQLSLKGLMEKVGLKHRPTFIENYINPAVETGILKILYPDKPNHPRQKYLLTAKGLALYNDLKIKHSI